MLSVTMKEGEKIVLFDKQGNVMGYVEIREIKGDKSRVSLNFPKDVKILRESILTEMESELLKDYIRRG